jgi:hypothetical protein
MVFEFLQAVIRDLLAQTDPAKVVDEGTVGGVVKVRLEQTQASGDGCESMTGSGRKQNIAAEWGHGAFFIYGKVGGVKCFPSMTYVYR